MASGSGLISYLGGKGSCAIHYSGIARISCCIALFSAAYPYHPGSRSLLEAECGHFFLAEQLQSVVPQARPCGSGDRQSGTYKLRFSVQLRQS